MPRDICEFKTTGPAGMPAEETMILECSLRAIKDQALHYGT